MSNLTEGDLRLTLPGSLSGRSFDSTDRDLSHCGLKAVDWILDLPERICFVEVKDPDDPRAMKHKNRDEFLQDFLAGQLTRTLAGKFRDSFLYEWACERVDKPISYYVIVASDALDDAQLLTRADDLKRTVPVGTPADWSRAVAHDCFVFNITKWNQAFPEFPLSRRSASGTPPS